MVRGLWLDWRVELDYKIQVKSTEYVILKVCLQEYLHGISIIIGVYVTNLTNWFYYVDILELLPFFTELYNRCELSTHATLFSRG